MWEAIELRTKNLRILINSKYMLSIDMLGEIVESD